MTFLQAARHVQDHQDNVAFVLVGGGKDEDTVKAKAEELGLKNIFLEGYQTDPYLYYKVFDVFVLTSKSEGLGSAILDAFAYRVPVTATAAGGIGELVQAGQTDYLAPVSDPHAVAEKILDVLLDCNSAAGYVENAFLLLQARHTIDAMAGCYAKLYQDLVETDDANGH